MIANYHTHTPRCNHAVGEERAYIERALLGGFSELGFSDHTPYFFDLPDYYSTFRMRPEELEDYVRTLLALREEYQDRIRLHIGLEAEYYPKLFPRLLEYLRGFPIDYLILGQHALLNETEGVYSTRPTEDEALLERYEKQTLEALETGLFSYFAHPDILRFVGDPRAYEAHVRRVCRPAKELDIPLEFNLLGWSEGKHYPNLEFWRIAGEEQPAVIIGCDAHSPEFTWQPELIARAEALLASFGLTPLERLRLRPIL